MIIVTSMIGLPQTLDNVSLPPYATQRRNALTQDIATATTLRKVQWTPLDDVAQLPELQDELSQIVQTAGRQATLLGLPYAGDLRLSRSYASTQNAISTSVVQSLAPTALAYAVRATLLDLKPTTGATTDAAGYAVGTKTINLAAAGSGALYADDVITFAGQSNEYTLLSGASDVSTGSASITLRGSGLVTAVPAAATAITLVRRGTQCYVSLNCINDVEALIATQSKACRDGSFTLGESIMLRSLTPITMVSVSASGPILANASRLELLFGE